MKKIHFLEANNMPYPNKGYKQFWFTYEGDWLMSLCKDRKPYYNYITPPGAKKKRWTRSFDLDLDVDTKVIKYVVKDRVRWWEEHVVEPDGTTAKLTDHPGAPPWVEEYAKRMQDAKRIRKQNDDDGGDEGHSEQPGDNAE